MPRNSNGSYTLPAGNPVVSGEVISTSWANPTLSDVGVELTNSLDRNGRGGMIAPFKNADGTLSTPGITWVNEPTTGFYRSAAQDMRAVVGGQLRMRWDALGVQAWNGTAWSELLTVASLPAELVNYARKDVAETITKVWTFADVAGASFAPVFKSYPIFESGTQINGYLEMAIPVGSPPYSLITFWDYGGVANSRSWGIQYSLAGNSLDFGSTSDAGAQKLGLQFVRGAGNTIASINYGNSVDKPLHTFHGQIEQPSAAGTVNKLLWTDFTEGLQTGYIELRTASGGGGVSFAALSAPVDERWWNQFATTSGRFYIAATNDAFGFERNVLNATRDGPAISGIEIGNPTDSPPLTVFGALNTTGALTQNGVALTLASRQIATRWSLTGGGDLTANRTLNLVGDLETPGTSWYYGTDAGGARGFFPLSGVVGVPEAPVDGVLYGRKDASWVSIGGGADPYVLRAGDTMTGTLFLTAASRPLRIDSTGPSITMYDTDGTANARAIDIIKSNNTFQIRALPDNLAVASLALQITNSTTSSAITGIQLGNTTDIPTLNSFTAVNNFGTGPYTNVATSAVKLGITGVSGRIELGLFMNDATQKPRAALFATDTGTVGLEYTFSSGITKFSFRVATAEVFSYGQNAVTLVNAVYLRSLLSNGTTSAQMLGIDASNVGYFGSDAALTGGYIFGSRAVTAGITLAFRTANVARLTLADALATFSTAATFSAAVTVAGLATFSNAGSFATAVQMNRDGTATQGVRIYSDSGNNYVRGVSATANGKGLVFNASTDEANGAPSSGTVRLDLQVRGGLKLAFDDTAARFYQPIVMLTGLGINFNNVANSISRNINTNTNDELRVTGRGALWGWLSDTLPRGRISIATTEPALTGSAGDIVLVYE